MAKNKDGNVDSTIETKMVAIDEIEFSRHNPQQTFDDEQLELLGKSMEEFTQLAPIILNEVDGELQLVAGERRLRAAMAAGKETIEAKVFKGLTYLQALKITLAENRDRVSLNVIEQARGYALLIDAGVSVKDIAASEHLTVETVEQRLELLNLPEEVRDMVVREYNPLPMYQALEIGRKVEADKQLEMANKAAAMNHGQGMGKHEFKNLMDELKGPKLIEPEESESDTVEVKPHVRGKSGKALTPGGQNKPGKPDKVLAEFGQVDVKCGVAGKVEYLPDDDLALLIDPIVTMVVNGQTVVFQAPMISLPLPEDKLAEVKELCRVKKSKPVAKKTARQAVADKEVAADDE